MGVLKTFLSWSKKLKHYWWSVDLAGGLEVTRITEKKQAIDVKLNWSTVTLQ